MLLLFNDGPTIPFDPLDNGVVVTLKDCQTRPVVLEQVETHTFVQLSKETSEI